VPSRQLLARHAVSRSRRARPALRRTAVALGGGHLQRGRSSRQQAAPTQSSCARSEQVASRLLPPSSSAATRATHAVEEEHTEASKHARTHASKHGFVLRASPGVVAWLAVPPLAHEPGRPTSFGPGRGLTEGAADASQTPRRRCSRPQVVWLAHCRACILVGLPVSFADVLVCLGRRPSSETCFGCNAPEDIRAPRGVLVGSRSGACARESNERTEGRTDGRMDAEATRRRGCCG